MKHIRVPNIYLRTGAIVNIAEQQIKYYKSDDFRRAYVHCFAMDPELIQEFFEDEYEMKISDSDADRVINYINENIDDFVDLHAGAYMQEGQVAFLPFGEQEVCLDNLYNHKTGENYNLPYLYTIFEESGFYVNRKSQCAYYDTPYEGIAIVLKKNKDLLMHLNKNFFYNPERRSN